MVCPTKDFFFGHTASTAFRFLRHHTTSDAANTDSIPGSPAPTIGVGTASTGVSVKLSVWILFVTQSEVQRSNLKPLPTGTARNVKSVKNPNNESVCRRIPFSSMNGNVEKRRLSAPTPTGKPVKLTGYF